MTDREVMQMALETLDNIVKVDWREWDELASVEDFVRWAKSRASFTAEALRAALAQPEPTVDGWPLYSGLPPVKVQDERETQYKSWAQNAQVIEGQYDPRREWVGLTDEEIDASLGVYDSFGGRLDARKIEAKLKEKNAND